VLKVGKILEQNKDISLVYTRKTDEFIELRERAKIANHANANLFVSIHCNSSTSGAPNGSETYVMGMARANMNFEVAKAENSVIFLEDNYKKDYKGFDPNNPGTLIGLKMVQENNLSGSIDLANKVQNNFSTRIREIKSKGIKQQPLWVLDASVMPGVLIEIGFVSSVADATFLESEKGQNDIASSIAAAITAYERDFLGDEGTADVFGEKPSGAIKENTIKSVEASESNKTEIKKDSLRSIYKIQLSASKNKLELKSKNFKGLHNVSLVYEDNIYKYIYGETVDYETAKNQLKEVKSKGFDSAFLIAFRNGKKISIQEATK